MRLADFILANTERILMEWETFARGRACGSLRLSVLGRRSAAEIEDRRRLPSTEIRPDGCNGLARCSGVKRGQPVTAGRTSG
jgi:hypothetical protein